MFDVLILPIHKGHKGTLDIREVMYITEAELLEGVDILLPYLAREDYVLLKEGCRKLSLICPDSVQLFVQQLWYDMMLCFRDEFREYLTLDYLLEYEVDCLIDKHYLRLTKRKRK